MKKKQLLEKQTTPGVRGGGVMKKKENLTSKGVKGKLFFEKGIQGNSLSCGQQLGILPPKIRNSKIIFAAKAGLSHRDPSQPGATSQPRLSEMNFCERHDWPEERSMEGSRGIQPMGEELSGDKGNNSQLSRDQLFKNNLVDPYE